MSLLKKNTNSITSPTISVKDKLSLSAFLACLLLIQPLLDTYYFYTSDVANITFGITIPPVLVVLAVFSATLYYFLKFKGQSASKLLLGYGILCIIYFVLHHLNCVEFKSFSNNNFGYSMINELYYVCRLIVPMLIIYLVWQIKFSFDLFVKLSCWLGFICSFVIVFSDIFKIGLCSYTNETIQYNIFDWGMILSTDDLLPRIFACKGYFSYANQISVLLTGLFPILCLNFFRKPKWYNSINLILMILAMLCIGTMTASIGAILEIITLIAVATVWIIYNRKTLKSKIKKPIALITTFAVVLGIFAILLPISPSIKNMGVSNVDSLKNKMGDLNDKNLDSLIEEIIENEDNADYTQLYTFIEYNYADAGIAHQFIEKYYPYKQDPIFWVAMIRNYTVGENQNYRSLQTRIMDRVCSIDGSKYNSLLGISATRETNIVKIERDLLAQYYSMGIIGVVMFFGIYFVVLLISAIFIIKMMIKKKFILNNVITSMSLAVMLCMGYYCGNSLDGTFLSVYLGLTTGVLLTLSTKKGVK